jgi:hypothetical protein
MVSRYSGGSRSLDEMKEFARFEPSAQRYVRRSLDVAFNRGDALEQWARDPAEAAGIRKQAVAYGLLGDVRAATPHDLEIGGSDFLGNLILVSAFDLGQARLSDFAGYRFLYERLLGARIRPWLPAAFCGAACLPHIHPAQRARLLASISDAAATAAAWSEREPVFFPQWIDKDEVSVD